MKFLTWAGEIVDLKTDTIPINLEAIAHQLSQTCRFNGGTKWFYSNLEHSLNVHDIIEEPELKYPGLIHDCHEGICGDIITPIAEELDRAKLAEIKLQIDRHVAEYFDCPALLKPEVRERIHHYDILIRHLEAYALIKNAEQIFPKEDSKFELRFYNKEASRRIFRKLIRKYKNAGLSKA